MNLYVLIGPARCAEKGQIDAEAELTTIMASVSTYSKTKEIDCQRGTIQKLQERESFRCQTDINQLQRSQGFCNTKDRTFPTIIADSDTLDAEVVAQN